MKSSGKWAGGPAGTYNVSQTCRFFGISRTQFYTAMIRI